MRNKMKTRVTGAVLVTLMIAGCEFIEPVTENPNSVPTASIDQLFTAIQVNSYLWAEGQIGRIASLWTQQMRGTDRQFVALDGYQHTETDANGEFSSAYTAGGLVDIRAAIELAEDAGRRVYAGILKIHEAYLIGMTASIFGDIPYSEAANPEIEEPVLDGQAAVYAAVQGVLDDAIADLASGAGTGPGATDLNFGGNAASWTAVAYTLKARFHIHWAESTGATAYTAALAAAGSGISSSAGTLKAIHSNAATENNLWFQFQRDRSGYISAGDHLVPLMIADADPRIGMWYDNTAGPPVAGTSELSPTGYGAPAFNFPIVSCAENAFIMAEAEFAGGDEPAAIAAATAGMVCQESEWGVNLTPQKTALAALTGAALWDEILDQKYIAMFLQAEAYNDYKRTCRPAITERAGGMPARLFYGQDERQSNSNMPEPAQQPIRNANDPAACP